MKIFVIIVLVLAILSAAAGVYHRYTADRAIKSEQETITLIKNMSKTKYYILMGLEWAFDLLIIINLIVLAALL